MNRSRKNTVVLTSVSDGSRTLRLKQPLSIELVEDPSTGLLMGEYAPLTISAYGAIKRAVEEQLADQLFVLWDEYVVGDGRTHPADAEAMRAKLLDHLEEVSSAEA